MEREEWSCVAESTPLLSQHLDEDMKMWNMCGIVSLTMVLNAVGINVTRNELVDKAWELGITDKENGGVSSSGIVHLARQYGTPGTFLLQRCSFFSLRVFW
jgi:uncharacterized protein YvpB